ncbi:MAG: histidine phosphatase family protein [Bacteriovoracaceae bacterium]|nr:histidine phosphatase family protein [Bacteriovoracaceae bacterium]
MHICQGHLDIPLNDKGQRQAKGLGQALSDIDLEIMYSSDLSRAFETAEIVCGFHNITIEESSDLRESHLGIAQGMNREDVIKKMGQEFWEKWLSPFPKDYETVIESGEAKGQVVKRVLSFLESQLESRNHQKIGVSTHGGVLRLIVHHIDQQLTQKISIPNCACYILRYHKSDKAWSFMGALEEENLSGL